MRLTKKDSAIIGGYDYVDELDNLDPIVNKLGRLEDIEEDLGIELPVLVRILEYLTEVYVENEDKPFYVRGWLNEIEPNNPVYMYIDIKNKRLCENYNIDGLGKTYYYFKEYGKTWALTKEELENE